MHVGVPTKMVDLPCSMLKVIIDSKLVTSSGGKHGWSVTNPRSERVLVGPELTVTMVWADDWAPHPDVATRVYVVVVCG